MYSSVKLPSVQLAASMTGITSAARHAAKPPKRRESSRYAMYSDAVRNSTCKINTPVRPAIA